MKRHACLSVAAALTVAFAALGVACSSDDEGSARGAGAASAPSASASNGDETDVDASSLTQQQLDTCSDLTNEAVQQIERATGAYSYPNYLYSCATDDDCVLFDPSTRCARECGVVIAKTHAADYAAAVATVNGGICATASGCPGVSGTCATNGAAACYSGACTYGLPAAWQSLAIETDTGGAGSTLPASCSGTSCTLWTVTPDAKVTVSDGSTTVRSATLSSADFATLDGILRSAQLRREQTGAINCILSSGPTHVSASIRRGDLLSGADVSSCVAGMLTDDAGPTPSNDYRALYDVLKGY